MSLGIHSANKLRPTGWRVNEAIIDFLVLVLLLLLSSSMDVHPSRELVCSGQRAGRDRKSQAHVRIWSTESLQTLYVFGMGELEGGVTTVAFSQFVRRPCVCSGRGCHAYRNFNCRMVAVMWQPLMRAEKVCCLSGSGNGDISWAK